MGERIAVLAKGKLLGASLEIELNHPFTTGGSQHVHLQSETFRLEMGKQEYIKYALSVMVAARKLKRLKELP